MDKTTIIKTLRDMAKHPTVTLPRDTDALKAAADLLEQPEPEPVAVVSGYYGGKCVVLPTDPARIFNSGTAFYTHPSKREWKGLTDQDVHECFNLTEWTHYLDFRRDPEAWCKAFASELEQTLKARNT